MFFVALSIVVLLLASVVSVLSRSETGKVCSACIGTSLGSAIGLFSSAGSFTYSTNIPSISFSFGVDHLSRFFLMIIFGISFLIGIYGNGYVRAERKYIGSVPFFPLLVAAMAGVVISRDALSFLIIWEIMSLASFFLVVSEHENKEIQNAGWIYLIATHLATAFLMAFFVIMARTSGSISFSSFVTHDGYAPFTAGLLFLFAVIGFGTKAGIFPFHVWLPRAHPAAPSYISAIMSGVMIKTGIYGILRTLTFLGTPPIWWGVVLMVAGTLSAVVGIIYAMMQSDLKKLLAYSSVENIGIIVAGLGIGIAGVSSGNMLAASLGFGGAIFHVMNHAVIKSLLFLSAGNIAHSFHSIQIDRAGGLIRKLPVTGVLFLIAALSICGLPPFNGFISEWLIYSGLFNGSMDLYGYPLLFSAAGIVGIAFAGGIAVACFTKAFGTMFTGEPRGEFPKDCRDPSNVFLLPMMVLAVICVLFGLCSWAVYPFVISVASSVYPQISSSSPAGTMSGLNMVNVAFALLLALVAALLLVRRAILRRRSVNSTVTWDCGYAHPTARMQYTSASFAEPIGTFFRAFLKPRTAISNDAFEERIDDRAETGLFEPMFRRIGEGILFIRRRRKNTAQSYLALIFLTLTVLFILEVWFGF